jgi:hypothetical protein
MKSKLRGYYLSLLLININAHGKLRHISDDGLVGDEKCECD